MKKVSIYVDYDNISIMLDKFYQSTQAEQYATEIIKKIRELYRDDKILTFKAFCDFKKSCTFLTELQKSQVELRHVYSSGEGDGRKNASDIALAIDVIKNLFNKSDCEKYVLVSSDIDMLPIINELCYNGKEVEVIYSTYGSKEDYQNYLNEWGIKSHTIEKLLSIEVYEEIKEETVQSNRAAILNIINKGINNYYKIYAKENRKGTCSKKDIKTFLKDNNYIENDISIIIDLLFEWGALIEHKSPYYQKYTIVLLNDTYLKSNSIELDDKVLTYSDYSE